MRIACSLGWIVVLCLLLLDAAQAQRRGVRVDGFGAGDWITFDDPTPNCPGWSNGSTLLLGPGYVFSGRDNPVHLTDTYCQIPAAGTLTEDNFFYADETGLAAMLGENPGDRITAIRYSLLDALRFSGDATGFQWIFYYFNDGGTIAALYGLEATTLDNTSYFSRNGVRLWDASVDGYDGEYFCFDGLDYLGTWDGSLSSSSPCLLIGFRLFRAGFE